MWSHLSFNMSDPLVGKTNTSARRMSLAYSEPQFIDTFYNGPRGGGAGSRSRQASRVMIPLFKIR